MATYSEPDRYNIGSFKDRLTLLEPYMVRDEQGGIQSGYKEVGTIYGKVVVRNSQSNSVTNFSQKAGTINTMVQYVTTKTATIRDVSSKYRINDNWRVRVKGVTYAINGIERLEETPPYYIRFKMQSLKDFQ